jgi:hypothetical protein
MSSESRNETLEALLEAKYELEHCDDADKAEWAQKFDRVLADLLQKHPKLSRGDIVEAICFKYREYKASRVRFQRRRESI